MTQLLARLTDHRYASLFSSVPWTEAVSRSYGLTPSASARTAQGAVCAAVPFSHVSDCRGERVICGPFSDYCDPLVEDAQAWQELIAPVLALGLPVTLRCLRNDLPGRDERFRLVGSAAWHAVDLTRPEHELWAGLAASARQNIRKALRCGVTVREGHGMEDVQVFHAMHCAVRKAKYRMLAQPLRFFEQLHDAFAPQGRLMVLLAEDGGCPLAGTFFIEWGDTLYYKFNASVDRGKCPNDLLVWTGIQMGQRRKLARLDFGLSDHEQDGLLRFKRKFATEEGEIRRLRWEPKNYDASRDAKAGQLLSQLTRLFTDPAVPDAITRAAGDTLYGLFC